MCFMPLCAAVCGSGDIEARGLYQVSATVALDYVYFR